MGLPLNGLDGHSTVLDKYMSELDPNNKQEYTVSPVRNEVTGKVKSWSILGDAADYEEMLEQEETARREEEKSQNAMSPVHLGFDKHSSDHGLPQEVASALKEDEAFAPAIYKAYKDCVEEKSMLLSKVEQLRLSRSQQLNQVPSVVLSSPAKTRPGTRGEGEKTMAASLTGTMEREAKDPRSRRQTIGDKIIEGSQVRALREYEKFNTEWADFKGKVSTKVGRLESDLVFERGPEFRRKKEELEMLELAIPTHERHGADQWTMSLRNNWTRYVPVGNIFSGLFCPVEDKPTIEYLEQITKPIHSVDNSTAEQLLGKTFGSSTLASRGRSWLDSRYLQRRRTQYSKKIAKVRQHSVGADTISVVGESIESRVEEQARSVVTLKDVEDKLSQTNPAVWELIRTNRQVRENFSKLEKERALAMEQEEREREDLPKEGPYLECRTASLEFNASVNESRHKKVSLTNKGTAAVKFSWSEQKDASIFDSEKTVTKLMFFLSNPIGVILPGETKTFNFGFRPTFPGKFWSNCVIQTVPQLPTPVDTLVLEGSGTVENFGDEGRALFISDLKQKIKERVTANEVARIVKDVKETGVVKKAQPLSAEEEKERASFVGANMETPENYFYMPKEFAELKAIYETALVAAEASEAKAEEGEEAAAPKDEEPAAENGEGEEKAEAEAVSAGWNGSISAIEEAISAETLAPEATMTMDEVKEKVSECLTKIKIPTEEGMVAYNAIYSLLCVAADKIEEHLHEEVDAFPAAKAGEEEEGAKDEEAEAEADKAEVAEGGEDADQGEGKDQEGEASPEEEAQGSEAKMAALDAASATLSRIDVSLADTCLYLGQEFDKQYAEIKAEADNAEDGTEEKQHLLWRLFEMSRRRTEIVGTWKA